MPSQLSACVLGLLIFAPFARAEPAGLRYELSIGYELPADANLARDAKTKEADAIEERNTADQACRPESVAACRRENELAFRKRIAAISQVKFWLALKRCVGSQCEAQVHDVFQLKPGEETSPEADPSLRRIAQAGRYVGIGLHADARCSVHRDSDNAVVSFPSAIELCRYQVDRLTNAIAQRDAAAVRALLADGVSPDQPDDWGGYPLQVAALVNNAEAAELLLRAGANQSVPAQHDEPSALFFAAEHGNIDVVRALLDHGGRSTHAVEAAASHGDLALARLLVEHHQPLGKALPVAAARGYPQIVKLLLDHGANPHDGPVLPFLAACQRDAGSYRQARAEIVPHALEGREIAQRSAWYGATTPWPRLPDSDYAAVLNLLLGSWTDLDADPAGGAPPLTLAAWSNNLEAAKFLVRHHANVNKPRPGDGKTALDLALSHRSAKLVRFLRAHGARTSR